ncbi:Phospholipase D gamma 2 [Camellia lanceoleosa]|uniref:Phospholipase D gamma 2 n=1 Tax=Camellia lanceoleosa TaxID=1840588 RepID=A0ACC0IPD0_9ERIC|nr:Phospholipase D gamma 2 [Camellia lanceoleosa]
MEEALLSEKSDVVKEKQSFERWSSYQYVERAGSIIPTASLARVEVSVDEIRSTTAFFDRYYPPSLHAPLISSPEPDPNGANNLILMEIALKIAEKIRARERFAAYIVISMWPEGNPTVKPSVRPTLEDMTVRSQLVKGATPTAAAV